MLLIKNAVIWRWESPWNGNGVPGWFRVNDHGQICDLTYFEGDSSEWIEPPESSSSSVIDAEGQLVLPGLIDSHIHVCMTGESTYFLNLSSCKSIEDMKENIRVHALNHPDLPWIIGVNWYIAV
jgi:hypothetical protein